MAFLKSYWKNSIILLIAAGCIERYDPPVSNEKASFLVVDGYLNTTSQTATVKLTTALGLSEAESMPFITQAKVAIEDKSGNSITLDEKGKGIYEITSPSFVNTNQYRLRVQLPDGRKYQSDYIQPLAAPPIDSITWKGNDTGTTIYANAHDDNNQTRYYKWKYTETWSYTASNYSYYELVNGQAVYRPAADIIYYCWGNEPSSTILINSTTQLDKDVVRDFPLTIVPKGSRKISKVYSILVEQRAITESEYEFWTLMKKTTESLGGLFDPLPSQVIGNVYSESNTSETVLGYFSAGAVQQKRIFIDYLDLPDNLLVFKYENCEKGSIKADELNKLSPDQLLLESFGQPEIQGYTTVPYSCADCTAYGGTTTKPDFWP